MKGMQALVRGIFCSLEHDSKGCELLEQVVSRAGQRIRSARILRKVEHDDTANSKRFEEAVNALLEHLRERHGMQISEKSPAEIGFALYEDLLKNRRP